MEILWELLQIAFKAYILLLWEKVRSWQGSREYLVEQVIEEEILKALKGISDIKAPWIDGYGASFFKSI